MVSLNGICVCGHFLLFRVGLYSTFCPKLRSLITVICA